MSEINEALLGLNLSTEFVEKHKFTKETEVTADLLKAAIEDIQGATRNQYREALANDPEFTKQFYDTGYSAAVGKERGTYEEQFRSVFGEEIPLKDEKGMLPYRKVFESLQGKLSGQGTEELQQQLAAANTELISLKGQIEKGEHPTIKQMTAELEAQKASFAKMQSLSALSSIIAKNPDVSLRPDDAALLVSNVLDSSFKWGVSENGFQILTKEGTKPMTKDKSQVIDDPAVIVRGILEERGYIKKNTGDPGGQPDPNGNGGAPHDPPPQNLTGYRANAARKLAEANASYGIKQ